jgi:cation diffusion facilitator CzcD-associated flavoprotein CzcO
VRSNWKWPDIPGLHTFKGALQHSAHYDETVDLKAKCVEVIGIGSSGVQIISSIFGTVSKLYAWVRSPMWITTGFAQAYSGPDGEDFECKTTHQVYFWFRNLLIMNKFRQPRAERKFC